MNWWTFFRRRRRDQDLDEEIQSHLRMAAGDRMERGEAPQAAALAARREFGNRTLIRETTREMWGWSWLETAWQDARYAVRMLRRSPGFAAAAVLTLAVGIGASTAVFSVVDLVLFRSLPYPEANRLVSVGLSGPIDTNEFNIGNIYLQWREQQAAFQSLTSMYPGEGCDLGGETPVRIDCFQVEANFLSTLGIVPLLGRDFRVEDDRPGTPKVALLGYGLWRSRFGGEVSALGRTIDVDGIPVRIAGVLPATFVMPQSAQADLLMPEQMDERVARAPNATVFLRTFARLKDGMDIGAARQRMLPLFEASVRQYIPPSLRKEVGLVVRELRDRQFHDALLASRLLFATVLALLALACANVANLLVGRAISRRGELAMRAALGASRSRLIRQMLAESLLLSLAGSVAACALAALLLRVFAALSPEGLVRLNQARLDARVLLFALGCALAATVLTGLAPAWEQIGLQALAGWRTAGPRHARSRQLLVAAQVAISLVLLSGASLLVRSLWKLESEPLGFRPERVLTVSFELDRYRYRSAAQQDAFYRALESQLAQIPGISQLALSDSMPPAGGIHARPLSNMRIAGYPPPPEGGGMVAFRYVTPSYFRLLGVPILAGRDFEERERSAEDTPLILSATLARRMFGAENPIGQQIELQDRWSPVIGVAADVKNSGLAEAAEPEYYRLRTYQSSQLGLGGVALLKTSLDEGTAARWVRQQIAAVDPNLPVAVETMRQRVSGLSRRQRFVAALVGLFAACGLLLAAIGLYGVLAFLVAQRTREIGVRMAMGATPRNIAAMVQRQAGAWTFAGIAAGLAASVGLGPLARALLFQVSPYDPLSLFAAVAILVLVAALAAWWPARRASAVDPAVSLRQE